MKIVHVTPHLGGGVGSAYAGITKVIGTFECSHEIILLERPERYFLVERVKENGVAVYEVPPQQEIWRLINEADIVQINWWHHPLMTKFLYEFPNIPVRLVCWVHVSGCTYPYLRADFLRKFEKIFFTTPYSYENAEIAQWIKNDLQNTTSVIYGMGDASRFFNIKQEPHEDFRIGYFGTLDFSKLHPLFVEYCATAAETANDIKFVMVGSCTNTDKILMQAKEYGIADRFEFRGFCEDVGRELSRVDCMGYLLNPYHFGASENVILETMAAGVPLIMMNQNTEKYFVENGKHGFLIDNKEGYRTIIERIYHQPEERKRIARNARKRIAENYSVSKNTAKLQQIYNEVMRQQKCLVTFQNIFGQQPSNWFLYFVEKEQTILLENQLKELPEIFNSESKSSIKHFAKYFPNDEKLKKWLGQ
jgi:glycosyltransferase involved in cell wall biosynthesis